MRLWTGRACLILRLTSFFLGFRFSDCLIISLAGARLTRRPRDLVTVLFILRFIFTFLTPLA